MPEGNYNFLVHITSILSWYTNMKIFTISVNEDGFNITSGATLTSHNYKGTIQPDLELGTASPKDGALREFRRCLNVFNSGDNTEITNVEPVYDGEIKSLRALKCTTAEDNSKCVIYLAPEPKTTGRFMDVKTEITYEHITQGFLFNGHTKNINGVTKYEGSNPAVAVIPANKKVKVSYYHLQKHVRTEETIEFDGENLNVVETKEIARNKPEGKRPFKQFNQSNNDRTNSKDEPKKQFRRPAAKKFDSKKYEKPRSSMNTIDYGNHAFADLGRQIYGDYKSKENRYERKMSGKRRRNDYDVEEY